MCGIAGVVKFTHEGAAPWAGGEGRNPDYSALSKMAVKLAHRGPDGEGVWVDRRPMYTVGLVHQRLSIVDLPCGSQPMCNEMGDVWVVFNGEIYNHALLRKELQAAGHVFKSDHSDTEVLVHGWEEWGVELPKRLLGMFALGIWDFREVNGGTADTLFLARDRMGQKPLMYATLEDGIVFGSTVGAIQAWPEVPRRVPLEQIGLYLLLGYFPSPQTVWRDISQVLPGAWVRVRKDVVDGGVYWERSQKSEVGSQKGAEAEIRARLERAVGSQMMADVPVACFLSGGIDSSIVATLMQNIHRKAGGDAIQTVSVGFAESGFDETAFAAAVAKKIGSRHTRLEVKGDADVMVDLGMLMETGLGMPFADSSILPTYQLSKAVRGLAPVALSGDGADELFGGYDRYRALSVLTSSPGFLAKFLPKASPVGSLAKREKYRRLAAAARAKGVWGKYTRLVEIFPIDLAEELLGQDILDYVPLPEEYGLEEDASALKYAMRRDQQEYLPGDVLWKVDAGSMAVALEVRSPFVDHNVVEFANGLDAKELTYRGIGKVLLRTAFAQDLPPEVQGRGKKGFGVPVGAWFKGELRGALTDLLFAADSFASAHLKTAVVRRLAEEHLGGARDHTHRLFALLTLELWWRKCSPVMEVGSE